MGKAFAKSDTGPFADMLLAVVEGTTDAIFLKDLEGRYLLMNSACARLFGRSPEQCIGKLDSELFSPEDSARLKEEDRRIIESSMPGTYEHSLTLNGFKRVFLNGKAPWRDREGRIVGVIGIAHDITDRKREEETRNWEARKAVHARDEFISIASHELRTPLTTFQLGLQEVLRTLRAMSGCSDHDRIVGLVERAERQGARLIDLVNDLLDVSQISAGKLSLRSGDVDLVAVVRSAIERLPEGDRRTVSLEAPGKDARPGRWDQTRIEQVITNLLTNAVKYGEGKAVSVRVDLEDSGARLVVEDRGIGMSADFLRRIFQPFERDGAAYRGREGLGLGLYITRQIVEAHGGSIEVHSEPGVGSSFTVELPWGR